MPALEAQTRVGVIAGGFPYEQDSVEKSTQHVRAALSELGYRSQLFRPPFDTQEFCDFDPVTSVIIDPYFTGEDGTTVKDIRHLLASLNCKYTGSNPRAAAICRDKALSKLYFRAVGAQSPRDVVIREDAGMDEIERNLAQFAFPVILKPLYEGSGVGVHLCADASEFNHFLTVERSRFGSLILEEYIVGIDTTVTVIGHGSRISALVPVEIELRTSPIYDYDTKRGDREMQHVPARHNEEMLRELRECSVAIHRVIGCRGLSRVDYRVRGAEFVCLEVNASPALGKHGNLPRAWRFERGTYASLIDRLLTDSLED
jgi:D-alanine-D-alanine ligase